MADVGQQDSRRDFDRAGMAQAALIERELAAAEAASLPFPIRQAAERLSTAVPRRHSAPFTMDPIGDAKLIVEYLTANSETQRT